MNLASELERIANLYRNGALTEAEYVRAKETLLGGHGQQSESFHTHGDDDASEIIMTDSTANTWAMILHLSQFAGYLVPFAGLIVPIVIWQVKKNDTAALDVHGRIVANWIISEILYAVLFGLLCVILIGIPLLIILFVIGIIFPIIGAVKASNGEAWRYPMSIRFF